MLYMIHVYIAAKKSSFDLLRQLCENDFSIRLKNRLTLESQTWNERKGAIENSEELCFECAWNGTQLNWRVLPILEKAKDVVESYSIKYEMNW